MKKKILLVPLALLLAMSLFACAAPAPVEPVEPVKVAAIWSIINPATNRGWDEAQFKGLRVLEEEYGWDLSVAEAVPYARTAMVAASYAAKGYDIVIFPDAGQTPAWMEVAPQYPDTWFFMMSYANELPDAERVAAWSPEFYTYGTIVGVTAAKITETGKIGIVAGVPIEVLKVIYSGVIEGAKTIDPTIEVLVSWTGSWVDLAKQSEVARLLLEQGCDVMHSMAGVREAGVLEATEAAGAYYVGYMSEYYKDAPSAVVTSVLYDSPPVFREMADAFLAGEIERKITPLDARRFSLADFHGMLPAETEAEVREAVEKLKTGEIKVPYVYHPEL